MPVGGRLGTAFSLKEVRRNGTGVAGESSGVGSLRCSLALVFFFVPPENMIATKIRVYGGRFYSHTSLN